MGHPKSKPTTRISPPLSSLRRPPTLFLREGLTIDFLAVSDAEHQHDETAVFDLADEPEIAHPVLPKFPQPRAGQRFSDAAGIVEFRNSLVKEPEDSFPVRRVGLAEFPGRRLGQFNAPGHGVSLRT